MSITDLITWKTSHTRYIGYLGKVEVFYVGYDGLISEDNPNKWKLSWTLPIKYGHRNEYVTSLYFKDEGEAKQFAEVVVKKWFEATGTRYDK